MEFLWIDASPDVKEVMLKSVKKKLKTMTPQHISNLLYGLMKMGCKHYDLPVDFVRSIESG